MTGIRATPDNLVLVGINGKLDGLREGGDSYEIRAPKSREECTNSLAVCVCDERK